MSQNTIIVINPASGKFVKELFVHDEGMLNFFMQNAREAQKKWEKVSLSDRLKLFKRLKRYIKWNDQELVAVNQSETGKTRPDAMIDVISAAAEIWDIEKRGIKIAEGKVKPHIFLGNKKADNPLIPWGIAGVISPWNLPLAIPAADIFPLLFIGNSVIFKPSEYASLTALWLEKAMRIVGFPQGVFKVVLGYGEVGAALCKNADYISFTGSCATGRKIKKICDARGISCNLEMGGKAPAIVLPDANIERTAYALVYGAFSNSGQYCKSFERVYVHRAIFNEVVDRVLRITNGLVPSMDFGPIITSFQFEIIKRQVEEARSQDTYIATGGQEISNLSEFNSDRLSTGDKKRSVGSTWYRPTILLYVDHKMAVIKDETFGPIMPIVPFDDIEEAIALANDSRLGLNASIFTENKKLFYEMAQRIEVGNVVGNDAMINWFITELPQSGRKGSTLNASGLSRHGLFQYDRGGRRQSRVWHAYPFMHIPSFKNKELWWLPYNKLTELTLKAFLWGF